MKLLLIRHAESKGNADGRIQGQAEYPLSAAGWTQARQLAARLAQEHDAIEQVYSSSQTRAVQTAEVLAEALGVALVRDERLREYGVGEFAGLTSAEIEQRFPQFIEERRRARGWPPIPGEEGREPFHRRIAEVFAEIISRHGRCHKESQVAVVSHGGTLSAYLAFLVGCKLERYYPFRFHNASLTVLDVGERVSIECHNDIRHLLPAPD